MTTQEQTCSHCGFDRSDASHDARCYPVAHALVTTRRGDATEADHHIVELARWLGSHPVNPGSPQARQARQDRLTSLDRWIAKAQLVARA
jgi:hypothetical protein